MMPALSGSRVGRDMQLIEAIKQVELSLDSLSWDAKVLEVSVVKKQCRVYGRLLVSGAKLYLLQKTVMCLLKK